jgi:hypothetical protein
MKINYKKSLKLITLLISSMLIATVSAQYYRFLYIQGSVTISATGLTWVKGNQAGTNVSISGTTATVSLSLSNGTTTNITNYLYLKNLDSTSHSITINITDAANSSLYEALGFNITIYDNSTGTYIDSLNVLSTASYHSGTISENAVWHITFQIATKTDSAGQNDDFAVQFTYE